MLNLVIALQAEAKPLISRMSLKKLTGSHAFPLFASDTCRLIISGIGKCNSAAATAWLAGQHSTPGQTWLNVGIAGHKDQPLGTMLCANRITDNGSGRNWYPVQISSPLASEQLITFDQPVKDYSHSTLYDMEATGFVQTALRFSTAELVQSVKIVSDNHDHQLCDITEPLVNQLIEDQCDTLIQYCGHLQALAMEQQVVNIDEIFGLFNGRWKFSVAQQRQLERLLQRHDIVLGKLDAVPAPLLEVKRSSVVLDWLRTELQNTPLTLPYD